MEEDITKFVRHHRELLLCEREENLQHILKDLSLSNLRQLEQSGQAYTKLSINNVANSGSGRFQIDLSRQNELDLDHGLSPGDLVLCLRQNQLQSAIRGVVTEISENLVSIAVNDNFENIDEDETFTLIKTDSDVTYKCQTKALNNLERSDLYNLPCYKIIEIAFGKDEERKKLILDEDPIPKEQLINEGQLKCFNLNLADDQKEAVMFALKRRHLAIIQGPPGTGKTTTLVELIRQLHSQNKKILVCAPTNVAVDNIVAKLGETETKPLRLGHPSRISKQSQQFGLDAYVKQNDGYAVVRDIEQSLKDVTAKGKTKNYKEMRELKKELKSRLNKVTSEILRNSCVILSTLNSATRMEGQLRQLPENFFDVVIVDESSQALEASMWIAVPNAKKLVMAGDINQLPPVVMSQRAIDGGLNLSLMERIINEYNEKCFVSLTRQYRMNEKIMTWSNKSFYNNSLCADSSVKCHLLKDLKGVSDSDVTSEALIFIDTCGCDCEEYKVNQVSGSKGNAGEAVIVEKVVTTLIRQGVNYNQIGVITPYTLQVDLVRRCLSSNQINTEVSTVDGFQGREKEVIILSLVRSNQEKELGFVTDFRRLNVAVTRARRLLVLIADSETMEKNELIRTLLKHIDENGLLQTAEEYLKDSNDKKEEIEKSSKKTKLESKAKSVKIEKKNTSDEAKQVVKSVKQSNVGMDLASYLNKERSNIYEKLKVEDEIADAETKGNDTEPKEDLSKKKNRSRRKKTKVVDVMEEKPKEDEFDNVLAEFSRSNYVCSFENCKVSTKLIHLACEFCSKWYCLQHGLQEVHGCGEAVRRKERKEFRHQPPPSTSKKEKDKFARKLKELEDARKPKKKATKNK